VIPEYTTVFMIATTENCQQSFKEPGVLRFDLLQMIGEVDSFLLVEVYRDEQASKDHKDTSHYQSWRDTVAPMMAEPRRGDKYRQIFPVAG
jgi:autoinducer 2-degrading protein